MDDRIITSQQKEMDEAVAEATSDTATREVLVHGTTDQKAIAALDERYYQTNARVGLENMTQDDLPTPVLKIVNSEVLMADGKTPIRNGHLYYASLDLDMEVAHASFLTYSKEMKPVYMKPELTEKVYVVMGALDTTDGFKPFKMYLRGGNVGVFKKLLGQVVALKRPMYALELELSTEKRTSQEGKTYYSLTINNKGVRNNSSEVMILEDLARQFGVKIQEETQETPAFEAAEDIPF